MEEDEYKKLSVEDRCVHKLWKARVNGYEEVTRLFRTIDDEKSPEFAKYLGLVKKFVVDSNAVGQEKGLEATLAYVENYANAGKTVGEVISGIVNKCIAAPRTKTRELALQVTLMYIEIEKQDAVIEELLKGLEAKNPKIVSACVMATTTALHEFGSKVITLKPLVKKIPVLFGDRDKDVRAQARALVVEMYRWIGPALRPQLNNLQPVQVTDLETEFTKIEGQKAVPTRYLRSQQEKQAKLALEADDNEVVDDEVDDVDEPVVIDPYEIADPVDILSKLPKDFYDKVEAKKWQERKEALETLENLLKTPKLESGDYGDLVRALKKMIQKDSNVVVVAIAAKCLTGLASGLKKKFQTYAGACIPALLEKFKEKKQNVVTAVRDASDAIYVTTTLENILEDVLEALGNKNPSVKSETSLFLARSFTKTLPTVLNKKILKAITGGLIKLINEPDLTVRESASEALGTLMKLVGEKVVAPFIVEIEKDALKMTRIKEFCENAVIVVKVPGAKKERPATAQPKAANKVETQTRPGPSSAPKIVKRPAVSAPKKKPSSEISSGTATIVKSRVTKGTKPTAKPIEKEISEEEAMEIVGEFINTEIITGLSDGVWKNRLNAVEQYMTHLQGAESNSIPTQALIKVLSRKPGLKDTNFQVLKAKLDVIKYLTTVGTFSVTSASLCVNDVTEKLGDVKNGATSGELLSAMADVVGLSNILPSVLDFASSQKSPKVLQESLSWTSTVIREFGIANLNLKSIIEHAKKALASNNASVRSAAICLFGILYLYMGPNIHVCLENEKQAIRDQINVECEKYENEKPPPPIRGICKSESTNSLDAAEEDDEAGGDNPQISVQDLLPRMDISSQITEALLTELSNKNWKVRNEALTKISNIISEAKLIKSNIGDLPQALALRLVDSNTKIAQAALNICENIATAMGPPCKQHVRTLFPGFLQGLGDSKAWIRTASVTCMNTFGDQCGYKDFFENEMIGDALKTGSPTLRSELWAWLAEKLPKIKSVPKEELLVCLPYLYSNLEDRNADVRKNAQECTLGIMIHLGYESMVKQTEKLKPASKAGIVAILEKVRPNLPAKPLPAKKQVSSEASNDKAVRGTRPASNTKVAVKPKAAVVKPVARAKKEEEFDTSPLYQVNNLKNQRTIDETKLKVLKWNFTTPREEFVELLKDQMTAANFNKTLVMNMFHSDFKYHLKAIDSLVEDINANPEALIANLDLIFKWFTLRFFDTNPSVLLKGLEYLNLVFKMLNENQYQLVDTEANSFIPYLILKIGDPKDSVRNGVKMVIKQIFKCYGVSRLFSYFIMEGLKSKNARQRAECLEVMGLMLSIYGLNVCLTSPAAALKEVAKQISDRDNSVRNAALNCLVQAYFYIGEKIFKMVGQISDKDMSLLEERIKRASKNPPMPNSTKTKIDIGEQMNATIVMPQINHASTLNSPTARDEEVDDYIEEEGDDEEENNLPGVALPPQVVQEVPNEIQGPFGLDNNLLEELDRMQRANPEVNLAQFDLTFMNENIVVPSIEDTRSRVLPLMPPKPLLPTDTFVLKRQNSPRGGADIAFEKNINAISSSHFPTAIEAIDQVREVLQSNKSNLMLNYEDAFMVAVTNQLKCLYQLKISSSVTKMYRSLLSVIDSFYLIKVLGKKASTPTVKELINQFLILLVDERLEGCGRDDAYVRVVNLQCVKIIERSDHTNIICALIQLLFNCIKTNATPRLIDLVMKCLWRVIKILPNWPDEIDYDNVLLEVHLFFKEFPTNWWKNKPVDTPLRTIKTIIHSMAKIKGGNLMLHLSKIPNTNDSEMEGYILKLLKTLKLEEVKQVPLKTDTTTRRSLTRTTHAQLTDIFQKIGNKEETKEGMNMLYDFLQQYPEADIEPFLKRSSPFFQEYIEKNLKEIEIQRKSLEICTTKSKNNCVKSADGDKQAADGENRTNEYYQDQLKTWIKKWDSIMNHN